MQVALPASLGYDLTHVGQGLFCRGQRHRSVSGRGGSQCRLRGHASSSSLGLPDAAVKESRDRVMTALINSGFSFTFGRTTINLAPADVKKEGPSFDLPIAVGMVAASEQMETDQLENFVMVGELALDRRGADRSKGCCRLPCARGSKAKSASWSRRRTPPRRRWLPACRSSRSGTCARRSASWKARSRSPRRRWISPASSTRTTRTRWTSPRSKARNPSSAPWRSPRPAGTTCC